MAVLTKARMLSINVKQNTDFTPPLQFKIPVLSVRIQLLKHTATDSNQLLQHCNAVPCLFRQ